jgi:hypothetical protein
MNMFNLMVSLSLVTALVSIRPSLTLPSPSNLLLDYYTSSSGSSNSKSIKTKNDNSMLIDFKLSSYLIRHDLTCFTCAKSKSNYECNRKAIDEPCNQVKLIETKRMKKSAASESTDDDLSLSTLACLTVHTFNSLTQKTISVEKKCSLDCNAEMVGCSVKSPSMHHNHQQQHIRVSIMLTLNNFIFILSAAIYHK